MVIDEARLKRQEQCIQDVFRDLKLYSKSCINACPGFGKTFMITELVFKKLYNKKPLKFIVLVGSEYLLNQWKSRTDLAEIITWQTAYKQPDKFYQCDILVIDEIHNLILAPKYINVFNTIDFKKLIVMSGTLDDNHKEALSEKGIPISHVVTEEEAISNGWLNKKKEYNLRVEMSYYDSVRYRELSEKYREAALFIDENVDNPDETSRWESFSAIARVNQWEFGGYVSWDNNRINIGKNDYHKFKSDIKHYKTGKNAGKPYIYKHYYNAARVARMRGCSPEIIVGRAADASKLFAQRAKLVYSNRSKVDIINQFLELFPNRKIVTFSNQTDFSDLLEKETQGLAYHGKMKKSDLTAAMDKFITNEIRVLHTVGKIKEGADIEGIDTAINCSTYSKWTDKFQKDARAGRIEHNKDETIVLNLYCVLHRAFGYEPTFEKFFLKKAQNGKQVEWIKNVNDIWQQLNTQ